MNEDALSQARTALEEKQAKLRDDLARISAPPTETAGISFGKRVGEGTSMAVDRLTDVATHDQVQSVLADVDRALAKIGAGTYGICDVCGEAIAPGRLEALPWAVLCVNCAGLKSN